MTRSICCLLDWSAAPLATEKKKKSKNIKEHFLLQDCLWLSLVVTAVCHQGALQLHGLSIERERNAFGQSVVRVYDKERKCDRKGDMGKVVRRTEMLGKWYKYTWNGQWKTKRERGSSETERVWHEEFEGKDNTFSSHSFMVGHFSVVVCLTLLKFHGLNSSLTHHAIMKCIFLHRKNCLGGERCLRLWQKS